MNDVIIAPSVLSADPSHLADDVARVLEGGADWLHVDVMDGHFVPNLTFGAAMIGALRKLTAVPLDVHLMVEEPERYIEPFAEVGATILTFHPEATTHVHRQLESIKTAGMDAGLALNPGTPLSYAGEVVADIDLLLIMSVNPGYAGQTYIPATNQKLARARRLLDEYGSEARLEVDGGIARDTIGDAFAAGADTFVAGSAVFGASDPANEVPELRRRCMAEV
ncbi:MAG: ribulose-phosphate 3-epimerase [Gemmatimonadales bacterium]